MPLTRKKLRAMLLSALFALFAIAATWYFLRPKEKVPTYKDKPLTTWLKGYDYKIAGPEWQEADEAVLNIGTNGIPTMLRMLRAKDSGFKTTVMLLLLNKQSLIKNPFTPAPALNQRASQGLQRLGIDATNAVPDLIVIFEQNISSTSKTCAALILGAMGPAAKGAVPSLLKAAEGRDLELRALALNTMGQICAEPERVVPVLIAALQDSDVNIRRAAVLALMYYNTSARPAIPALIQCLDDSDYEVRRRTLRALDVIDPAAAKKARADEYKR